MRCSTSFVRCALVISFVSLSYLCNGQLSLMAEAAGVSLINPGEEYNINVHWPGDNEATGAQIAYLRDATGSAWSINALYDIERNF